jgi:hypothetical protein
MLFNNADNSNSKINDCQMTASVMQPYNSKLMVTVSFGRMSIFDPTSFSSSTVSSIGSDIQLGADSSVRKFTM